MKYIKFLFALQGLFCILFYNFSEDMGAWIGDGKAIVIAGGMCILSSAVLFILSIFGSTSSRWTLPIVFITLLAEIICLLFVRGSTSNAALFVSGNLYIILAVLCQLAILVIAFFRLFELGRKSDVVG